MIVPIEKDIVDLVTSGATMEAEKRIVALKVSAMTAQLEITSLREKVSALERELALRNTLSFDGQFYWSGGADRRDGPYCPTCFDTERLMLRLQFRTVEEIDYETGHTRPGAQVFYKCSRCSRKSIQDVAA
jgi:hypothetical protein